MFKSVEQSKPVPKDTTTPPKKDSTPLSDSEHAAIKSVGTALTSQEKKKEKESVFDVKWGEEEKANDKKLVPLKGVTDNNKKDDLIGSNLPPLRGNKFDMGLDSLLMEKERLDNEANEMKAKSQANPSALDKKETPDQRKERLKAQRDKILAKKKLEREAELHEYQKQDGTKVIRKRIESVSRYKNLVVDNLK